MPDQAPQTLREILKEFRRFELIMANRIEPENPDPLTWGTNLATTESALTALIERVIGEDYPKGYPYDDPEFVRYANIEHDRQRKRLANLTKNGE